MSIEGRIDINVAFQDKDGQRLKVVSLNDSREYTTGKVAVITGTAGTASLGFNEYGITDYRDASGSQVSFSEITRVGFRWSSGDARILKDTLTEPTQVQCSSLNGELSIASCEASSVEPQINAGPSTGTYTIILYGS